MSQLLGFATGNGLQLGQNSSYFHSDSMDRSPVRSGVDGSWITLDEVASCETICKFSILDPQILLGLRRLPVSPDGTDRRMLEDNSIRRHGEDS
jgi:hypothetical protein